MFFVFEYLLRRIFDRLDSMEAKMVSALDDLTAAVAKLTTEEAQFLTDIAGQLTGSVSDAQAEELAGVINQRAADLAAADPGAPPAPPVVTPGG